MTDISRIRSKKRQTGASLSVADQSQPDDTEEGNNKCSFCYY
jgi:hypothetical protein